MNLINSKTGKKLKGVIELVEKEEEFKKIDKDTRFLFEWTKEKKNQVFKIRLADQEKINQF